MKVVHVVLILVFVVSGCGNKDRDQAQTLSSRASYLIDEGKYADAIPLLEDAVSLRPDCVEYHVGLAMAYTKIEEYSNARDEYEKALPMLQKQAEVDPERVDDLIMVLICLNRPDEAKRVLNEFKKKFKDNPAISTLADNFDKIIESFSEYKIKE